MNPKPVFCRSPLAADSVAWASRPCLPSRAGRPCQPVRHRLQASSCLRALAALALCVPASAAESFPIAAVAPTSPQTTWRTGELYRAPATFPVEEPRLTAGGGVRPVFFEGVPWRGKPTRVFAWIGVPAGASAANKVPAMVLIHGGQGTALRSWVELWMARGYAAISFDTCGHLPTPWEPERNAHARHAHAGPVGWAENFKQIDEPVGDQWIYHAIADAVLAHSLLRSLPEVDAARTGVTGISWGGFLTHILAGVDDRYRLAVPVYGTAFLGDNSTWQRGPLQQLGRERAMKWLSLWDPSQHLPRARMPMLFVNGTNDRHSWVDSWAKTHRLPAGPRTILLKVRMPHGHPPAGDPPEITAFADGVLRAGPGLVRVERQGRDGAQAWATFAGAPAVVKAEIVWTSDRGEWPERKWQAAPAAVDAAARRVSARVPPDAAVFYLNLHDARGLLVSTDSEELPPR